MVSQTEQAFNIDAEGRRRRRPSQAYLERSKEGTGQVVENVLGALPGIGTAMTVEEIQEELQKDDPNYGKIALLGGSELIGLIPGLGTAAKAGLRKVANNIGADRIIKALDAPKPKPESEIIAGPGATGYYDSNYDRAKELKERGYSPSQIEQMTGRFQTGKSSDYVGDIPENPFKFEIDDSRVEIRGSDGFQTLKESTRHYPIAVGHIIPTHTELFKEYPNLRNVAFYIDPKKTGSGAHFDPSVGSQGAIVFSPNNKSLTSPNKKGFRNTFFHELQHAAQFQDYKIAGLKQLGGGPVFLGRVGTKEYPSYKAEKDILGKNKNFVKLRDEILDIFEKQRGTGALDQTSTGATLPGQVPNPSEVFGDVAVAKKIARKMRELESDLFKTYMKTVSEVEARVVGRRAAEIATVGSVPKPRVTSNLARERKIETLKEFQSDEPKSLMGKKVEDFKLKLGPMTDEEILRYATGGINFARYAKGIDKDLQGFGLFGPTKPNYSPSENIGFTPELKPFRENPDIEPEVEDAFTKLADIQRGEPELAMVEAQKIYGGGVMPYALEHAGDLTHRMAERGGRFGAEFVAPKVTRLLDSLLSDYGFEKEMLENIQSNARFHYKGDNPNISFEEYKKEYENNIDKSLKKYSEAHKKVPVYNKMQLAGREAAIAIGEKRYTDAIENLYIIDQAIKDGTYKQAALEFDPNIDFRKESTDFNKGGTVMNRQMEMAFMKEGGLKDDGMKVDPVSGNEIPPGSMAKEVRDDIPAQLSEGEYVVPADVVQFYGVKHFEDLRNKAKGGLKQMENDGRIGGEPVYANAGTMVQGGFSGPSVAPAQPGVAQIPMPLQNPAPFNPMQTPLQGNPGAGFVYQTPGQQAYNQPTRYYGSFSNAPQSITQPPNTPVPVVGQPVTPPVDTPESCAARGMVFNPETGMCVLPDPVQTPQPTGGDDKDRPDFPQGDPNAWMDKYDYENVDNLLEQSSGALDPATGLAGFVGKVLGGGVLGLFAKGSNAAQVAANINVLSSIPESSLTASQKESLAGLKTKYENYVTSNNLDIFGTELINGDQLAIDIITNPKNRGKGLFLTADSVDPFGNKIFKGGEKDPKFIKVMEDVASPGYTYVPGDDDNLGYYKADSDTKLAPDTSLRPPTRPTNVTPAPAPVTNNNNNNNDDGRDAHREAHKAFVEKQQKMSEAKSKVEEAAKKDPSAGIYTGGGPSGGFNKGGLMRKKKK